MSAISVVTLEIPERAAPEPAAGVGVALLGGFAADVDGEPVPERAWRLKKARELVKLLALAPGHRLHREQVMDVLWRDREPAAAANNLHQAVYVVRRALGAHAIELREELLQLTAEVDVDRLEIAAAEARGAGTHAAYEAALSLYGGELLPENRYDDWAQERREELEDLATALARGAGRARRAGYTPSTVPCRPPTSSFVGRERELGELRACLRGTRLLTLVGTGGVGKTRLALELGRMPRQRFRTASRWSSLPRSPIPRWSRTRSLPRSTCGRCPDRLRSTRSSTTSRRPRSCSCSTTASTCWERSPGSPRPCCAPLRG